MARALHGSIAALFVPGAGVSPACRFSYHAGFEKTFRLRDDVTDAFVAYAVGFVASGLALFAFGVLTGDDSPGELLGKISLQAVPASMGAILARSQLGIEKAEEREKGRNARYAGEIFLMGAGALFFSFNVAPTEEVMLITYKIGETRVLAIMAASLTIMHAFTYTLGFRGQADPAEGTRAVKFFFLPSSVTRFLSALAGTYCGPLGAWMARRWFNRLRRRPCSVCPRRSAPPPLD